MIFHQKIKLALSSMTVCAMLTACGGSNHPQSDSASPHLLASVQTVNNSLSLPNAQNEYVLSKFASGYSISESNNPSAIQFLNPPVQRLHFADTSLALDIDGNAGKIFRLYQAVFNRLPDSAGLGYWLNEVDKGMSLTECAVHLIESAEFLALYGKNPDDSTYLNKLYSNVLHRTPDAGGFAYWQNLIQQGMTRVQVLKSFAESNENQAFVAPAIQNGIRYTDPNINYRPIAIATVANPNATAGLISVDGSASIDTNNDHLQYVWRISSKPENSAATLISPSMAKPSFYADLAGRYEVTLVVSDGKLESAKPAVVAINVFAVGMSAVADSGHYRCANLSAATAQALYFAGHLYLDRDADGKPCERNDITMEASTPPVITPPVVTPPVVTPPVITPNTPSTGGMCWVNGYTRRNGTHVNGYYRRC